jgi:hypothetical protein
MRGSKARTRSLAATIVLTLAVSVGAAAGASPAAAAQPVVTTVDGPARLWNKAGAGCLVPDSQHNVYAWSGCGSFNDQLWYRESSGVGFRFRNYVVVDHCLRPVNTQNNAQLIVWPCGDTGFYFWGPIQDQDFYYRLQNHASGYCALAQNTSAASDPAIQWTCNSNFADQWWKFSVSQ